MSASTYFQSAWRLRQSWRQCDVSRRQRMKHSFIFFEKISVLLLWTLTWVRLLRGQFPDRQRNEYKVELWSKKNPQMFVIFSSTWRRLVFCGILVNVEATWLFWISSVFTSGFVSFSPCCKNFEFLVTVKFLNSWSFNRCWCYSIEEAKRLVFPIVQFFSHCASFYLIIFYAKYQIQPLDQRS